MNITAVVGATLVLC